MVWVRAEPDFARLGIRTWAHLRAVNRQCQLSAVVTAFGRRLPPILMDHESYPGRCYLGGASPNGLYQRKHVPFLSFKSITGDMGRCAKVRPLSQFGQSAVAEYVFITPDMCNDGHDACGDQKPLDRSAKWLQAFLEPMIADPAFMKRTLIIVTFDESARYEHNHIYTVFLGGMVKPGEYSSCTDHYNVLRTIEDNYGLGSLNAEDKKSSPITSVWKSSP